MTQRAAAWVLAAAMLLSANGCGRRAEPVTETREEAYRANNRAIARLEDGKYQEAVAELRRALSIDPSLTLARINLAIALFYAQDAAGAAREASEAARLAPAALQPPYLLGLIARSNNQLAEAERLFRRIEQIDPHDIGTAINLGQIYLQQQKYGEAIAVLQRAVAGEGYNVTATYTLGLALSRSGRATEGAAILERSQALRSTPYATTLGPDYGEQGRYAEGVVSTGGEPPLVDPGVPVAVFRANAVRTGAAAGVVTLFDFDVDGRLDLLAASRDGVLLFRNGGAGGWTDVTKASGLASGGTITGAVAGDYDNDGLPDLLITRTDGVRLHHNEGSGRFRDVTDEVGLRARGPVTSAAFVDVDHDGDLDIVAGGPTAPLQLMRNNGNGTFTDVAHDARVDVVGTVAAIVPTDFDNRRDIDLLVVYRDGPPRLFKNRRDGTFEDVAREVGLDVSASPSEPVTATAVGDVNKDDFPDFFFSRPGGGTFAFSNGRGGYTVQTLPRTGAGAVAAQFVDYDNDGLLDLLTWSSDGPHLFRNVGREWADVTDRAFPSKADRGGIGSAASLALGDLDGDGTIDLVISDSGGLMEWRNSGDASNHSVAVRLVGTVSNRQGVGAKVQLRAGSLGSRVETAAATPAISAASFVFGLGRRRSADVVRVLWPSGIVQTEPASASTTIQELNRKPSSCPFLFTWNGDRFEFVTDFMGGGEMGDWTAPGHFSQPAPVEYVRIRGEQLKPRNGVYEVRVTAELEEAVFIDRLQLYEIAHPSGVDVFPAAGLTSPPKQARTYVVRDEAIPAARDDHGHDVTERIAAVDRRYVDDFAIAPVQGYAREHALTIDIGSGKARRPVLLLTGWTDYAFSSNNVAASQSGMTLTPPAVEVRDAQGRWRTVVRDVGFPVGRPQTIPIDLAPLLKGDEHEVRVVTNMRIYWDQVRVASASPEASVRMTALPLRDAFLRARGFSNVDSPDGKEPETYDYARVNAASAWKAMPGRYTREGDVKSILTRTDDQFVIARPGDEVALRFDASTSDLPAGWTRTFFLLADGFSKEMDINSASPDRVEPLPFHAMSRYPYEAPERYPDTPENRQYLQSYNTRIVRRALPSLSAIDVHH